MAKKMIDLDCPTCGVKFQKAESHIRMRQKDRGQTVFYCSRSCGYSSREKGKITMSALECCHCGKKFERATSIVNRRKKIGIKVFYCGEECQNKAHSMRMSGRNNPNYEGEFHGGHTQTKEQLIQNGKNAIARMKANGTYATRMRKLQQGHKKFFATEKGKDFRRKLGVMSSLSQRGKRSSIEIAVENELKLLGIDYEIQKPFKYYLVDFYIQDLNLVIECDGDYWHSLPKSIERDKQKDAYISSLGHKIARLREHEIKNDCKTLVRTTLNNYKKGG